MNRENIKTVRDHLLVIPEEHFNMQRWTCGTAACIGGWTDRIFNCVDSADWTVTAHKLGLSEEDAHELFFMHETPVGMDQVDRRGAVAVLDHLLETGKVDWSIISQPEARAADAGVGGSQS